VRVGLVLGAGGLVGGAWLVGTLAAVERETGWSPADAEVICGTSAGAVVGALTAAGLPPADLVPHLTGDAVDELARMDGGEDHTAPVEIGEFRLLRALPSFPPGSWRMALNTLLHPTRHAPATMLAGLLPPGLVSTEPIAEVVERFAGTRWPDRTELWTVACDYATGRRVAFGREDGPPAPLADAVAASCAIPGFYRPVRIGGRRYVDGGVCSLSNLDLLAGRDLDLVLCLNPMSTLSSTPPRSRGGRTAAAVRTLIGRQLGHEAGEVRSGGTDVVLLQPTADDLAVMGSNPMARGRGDAVVQRAVDTTSRELRRLRRRGVALPGAPAPVLPFPARLDRAA
jgi:NTE family protein